MSYRRPQVQVFQEFRQLPQNVVANLNAFPFGPNYRLFRYAYEKSFITPVAYNKDADEIYAYPNQPVGSTVDLTYVKLFMENVWAQYASISATLGTPLVAVSADARNKLRAMPRIDDAEKAKEGVDTITNGVTMDVGGYAYNSPALPETFYLYPQGGAIADCLSRLNEDEDATLAYLSKQEGQRGTVSVLGTDAPLTAGHTVQGPYGLVFDLDAGPRAAVTLTYTGQPTAAQTLTLNGAAHTADSDWTIGATARETYDNLKHYLNAVGLTGLIEVVHVYGATTAAGTVYIVYSVTPTATNALSNATTAAGAFTSLRQPTILTFRDTAGDNLFTLTVDPDSINTSIDESIDSGLALKVKLELIPGAGTSVSWSDATRRLTIGYEAGVTTLADLRAALAADSDVVAAFDVGEYEGDALAVVDFVADETTSAVTTDWDVYMVRDAFRIKVFPNDVTWATGNGFTGSAHFKTRGVRVGDRLRYSVVGTDSEVYTGTTRVVALEADRLASQVLPAEPDADNAATQSADLMYPHTGADIVAAGADNQRDFDGAQTKVYALAAASDYFPGDYGSGVLSDVYTAEITLAGPAGTARASISTASGAYSRVDVPILPIIWDDADADNMAMLYLGNNLWMVLHKGAGDADAEFQLGDQYTFSRAIVAPWTSISQAKVTAGGAYTGPRSTTYRMEVVRGGVFNRTVNAFDGMLNPCRAVVTYTGLPSDGDTLTIGGMVFEFDNPLSPSYAPGNVPVDIEAGDEDATYAALVEAILAQGEHLYPVQDAAAGTVTIRGPYANIVDADEDLDNATLAVSTAVLNPVMDFEAGDWAPGDVDDEYVLKCTKAGTITNAQFSLTSQRGDDVTVLEFSGSGVGATEELGAQGLSGYFTLSSGSVAFSVGDFWIIKVNGTRPRVKITDAAGVDQSSYEVINDGVAVNVGLYGVTAVFADNRNTEGGFAANGGLVTGDVFHIEAIAAMDGPLQTLVLADDLPVALTTGLAADDSGAITTYTANYAPTPFNVWLYLLQTSTQLGSKRLQSPPDRNWVAAADGVTVYADMEVQDPSWVDGDGQMPYMPVYQATMYVEYRALVLDYADGIYSLSDIGDVVPELGTVHPDNPLAQGVYNALLNSGDQPVYFMATRSPDLAGFTTVLGQAAKTGSVYGLAPLTRNDTILAAVQAHIADRSGETEKKWRIGFFGTELPVNAVKYDATTFTPAGTAWLATIKDDPATPGEQYTLVEITNGTPTLLSDVVPGDEVRVKYATDAWADETYETYAVASVLSNTKLLLVDGPASPVNVAAKIEIWHTNTAAQIADAVAARSRAFGTRRVYHVFPDVGYIDGVAQTSEFLAAAVAGLNSSVIPQQGLTNTELNGFDNLPAVYGTYTKEQLDVMAGGGTLILMQDAAGDQVYVRHQVSTATSGGNILTTELSVTKNLDAISYYFAGVLAPYIGRYNITPELLVVIQTQVQNGLNYLGSDRTGAGLLGPMVILGDSTQVRRVEQHPTLKDHIVVIVDLQLPLPVNVIQLHLVV